MQITIKYPDDCSEHEATLYATGCFNPMLHHYDQKIAVGQQHATFIVFDDDRTALFYLNKRGYVLELDKKTKGEDSKHE